MPEFNRDENKCVITGRRRMLPCGIYYAVSIATLGLFHVLCTFFPRVRLYFETKLASVGDADILICNGKTSEVREEGVGPEEISDLIYEYVKNDKYRYALVEGSRYVYSWLTDDYHPTKDIKCIESLTRKEKEILFGKNELPSQKTNTLLIFFHALFEGVNVYTIFGIILWIHIEYYIYAFIIFLLMGYNLMNVVITEKNKSMQSDEISRSKKTCFLLENGVISLIKETDVVLNDWLVLFPHSEVPCDAIVVEGSVAVDEGFVTGESVPILKKENAEVLAGSIVFQSTLERPQRALISAPQEVERYLESNNYCIVRAIRISYNSAKGKAFKSLAEEKVIKPPVYFDTVKIIGVISIMLIPCMASVFVYLYNELPMNKLVAYIFDLVYSLVSPSLPTAIMVGMSICASRLMKKKIQCKNISISNISGTITKVCFDKTGTLTEEGLDIKCININGQEVFSIEEVDDPVIKAGLCLCHSVEKIGDKHIGDPLDAKMLQFTAGSVEYSTKNQRVQKTVLMGEKRIGTIGETFDFDSNLRRMSTISEMEDGQIYAFAKGSAETIHAISNSKHKIEENMAIVDGYAKDGYRVITLAGKPIDKSTKDREAVESELEVLCNVVFENKLKRKTADTIEILTRAGLSNIMCTGDSLLTAVSVATQCGIIEQYAPVIYPKFAGPGRAIENVEWVCINDDVVFDKVLMKVKKGRDYSSYIDYVIAIEGSLFELFMQSYEYKQLLMRRCKVFSRMNPSQKSAAVEMYKKTDLVCFMGDGANDCNAINMADVGISLSNSEEALKYCFSSYLSNTKEISCILDIIKEGKCALVTTVCKIEQILIITISQFCALLILLFNGLFMSDTQNIYVDIFINIPLSILMSRFKPAKRLSKKTPKKKLLRKSVISGMAIHCLTHTMHLFILTRYLKHLGHTGFVPPEPEKLSETSQLATGIFIISNIQALYSGMVYAPGAPFRQGKGKCRLFIWFYICHFTAISIFLVAVSNTYVSDKYFVCVKSRKIFNLQPLSVNAVLCIVGLAASDSLIIELVSKLTKVLLAS
ncbi:cation-transporting P-type ATPase 13A2 [Nematocida major]|uniref:cation-transporting P-type ATPase 13A2 n=1 Tax=Nematocida major TaxID=1912982 RepID=UPI002007F0CC|nr:cation-transporting P-type ATPase 13A2 [Nematocida major]KAH9386905.1 cation-transporting P-type ATPase 13A2 [Nematocida major]